MTMPYSQVQRNITVGLWEQRRPKLKRGLNVLPILQSAGTAVATASAGWTLTAGSGSWDGPSLTISRQWQRDGANITNQTNASYAVTAGDSAHTIACKIVASNKYASAYATALATVLA
jgi:hypothetical protein